jgi:hypothetical protein
MKKLLILLLLSTSFSTFAHYHLDFSLSDFCYQQPEVQDRSGISELYVTNWYHVKHDGVYYFPNEEEGITATSLCIFKDEYGQYDSKGSLKKGKKNGKWIHWWSNGQKWVEANWKDGKKDGAWTAWERNGSIDYEENWKDNKMEGKWTWWHQNGQIKLEGSYKNDKANGIWTWWSKDGSKLQEGTFLNGESEDCDDAAKTDEDGNRWVEGWVTLSPCNIYVDWMTNFDRLY